MIAIARAFICDPGYARKAYEGWGEDVVPCIRCNKCHVPSLTGPWISICSVNPLMGIAHKVDKMVAPHSQEGGRWWFRNRHRDRHVSGRERPLCRDYQGGLAAPGELRATTTSISAGGVSYIDAEGNEKTIEADSVVVAAG